MVKQEVQLSEVEKVRLINILKKIKGPIIINRCEYPLIGHITRILDSNKNMYDITEL